MNRTFATLLAAAAGAATAAAQAPLNEDFDCYEPGAAASTLPGWELWLNPPGEEGYISEEQSFSGASSLQLNQVSADVVRQVAFRGVPVTFSAMTHVPSASAGLEGYVIALAEYDGGGAGTIWGLQVKFDATVGEVDAQFGAGRAPLIFDRWVECRAEIDLVGGSYDLYYDGALLAQDLAWVCGITGQCSDALAAIDFYLDKLDSGPGMYIDDVVVAEAGATPPPTCGVLCYADCDVSGAVDFFDFLCFQNLFAAGDARADCDQDAELTFFDFLCFQNAFAAGCP